MKALRHAFALLLLGALLLVGCNTLLGNEDGIFDPDFGLDAGGDARSEATTAVGASLENAAAITEFSILGSDGSITGTTISLTLPFGTDLTSLTPTIAIIGVSVSPASGVAQNFTKPVVYTVTAANGGTKAYTVTVRIAPSDDKDITQFVLAGIHGTINGTSIALTVPFGTNVTSLTPTVGITGASVTPASGTPQDFTNAVVYTVTASDGSTKAYAVTVNVAAQGAKDITRFTILGVGGAITATSISLTVPSGTNLTSLTPTIDITGKSVTPASGAPQNFASPVTYTVTAADNSTKTYTVTVNVAESSSKDITQFTALGVSAAITGSNIALTLPVGTNVTNLTPSVAITGKSVSPASGTPQNFSSPVTYTVTAADGSTQTYAVTVNVALSSSKDITQFTILGVTGTISGTSIALTLPTGTNVTSLTPTVAITGTSMSPASGAAKNFTSPVAYTVTAADNSTKAYTVTVNVAASTSKDITQFTIVGVNGTISGTSIALTVPAGTDATSLTPTITITGASVNPASGVPRNFTSPVTYTVTAADNSTKAYTVTVTVPIAPDAGADGGGADGGIAPDAGADGGIAPKDITQFTILGVNGTITGTNIALTVPNGTNLSNLTPTILFSGTGVSPASGVARSFVGPVTYTVTAADLTTRVYTVTVTAAPSANKDLTEFRLSYVKAAIVGTQVFVTLPTGTNVSSLFPSALTHTGISISPGFSFQNFTNPVTYTVTAADGSTKAYTVTVTVGPGAASISSFTILGVTAEEGFLFTGTGGSGAIDLSLFFAAGVSSANLTPTFSFTGVSASPSSGVAQSFGQVRRYTATAADGSAKLYDVYAGHRVGGHLYGASGGLVLIGMYGVYISFSTGVVGEGAPYSLALPVPSGLTYTVGVQTPPPGKTCTVANGTAVMGTTDLTNVDVTCN